MRTSSGLSSSWKHCSDGRYLVPDCPQCSNCDKHWSPYPQSSSCFGTGSVAPWCISWGPRVQKMVRACTGATRSSCNVTPICGILPTVPMRPGCRWNSYVPISFTSQVWRCQSSGHGTQTWLGAVPHDVPSWQVGLFFTSSQKLGNPDGSFNFYTVI